MKIEGITGYGSDMIRSTYQSIRRDADRDFAGVLERAAENKEEQRLKEVCQELEAVFLNMVFQRMRATIIRGGLIKESLGEDIFTSMLDSELAREMSKGGSTGIADVLYRQLSENIVK